MNFFLKDLRRQLDQFKPDDSLDFTIHYFKQVQSCYHIIGTGYSYILESIHNRKALIFCLMESFKSLNNQPSSEITPNEIYYLIEQLCPGFPKSIVLEAAMLTVNNVNHIAALVETKCRFDDIFRNISCFILYDEWLKLLEEYFRNDGKGMFLSIMKLKIKLEEIYRNLSTAIYQPSFTSSITAVDSDGGPTTPTSSSLARSHDREISFDQFKKNLFRSRGVASELALIARLPHNC